MYHRRTQRLEEEEETSDVVGEEQLEELAALLGTVDARQLRQQLEYVAYVGGGCEAGGAGKQQLWMSDQVHF
jgi:hypothetical protein